MEHNCRWLNRTRLNVNFLESRVQPGSLFTAGLEMADAGARQDRHPDTVAHNVLMVHTESIRIMPAAVQRATAESTPDIVAHPDQLLDHAQLRAASFAEALPADPLALGTSTRSRMVRQRADSGVMARQGGSADVAVPSASVSIHSRAIPRAVAAQSGGDAAVLAVPFGFRADSGTNSRGAVSAAQKQTIAENYGQLPLSFEQNVGQFDDRVDFVARTGGMTTFLTPTAAVFAIQNSEFGIQNSRLSPFAPWRGRRDGGEGVEQGSHAGVALYMEVVGGNPEAPALGGDQLPGIVNYFIGNDPSQWYANITTFGRVTYEDVYPGIDLVYYGNNGALEYDFIVSPEADPNVIGLNFAGADGVEVDSRGALVLHTAAGDVVQQKPLTYQLQGDSRQEIASRYLLNGTSVRFEVGAYDLTQPLVIDPLMLGYSTYLGGSDLVFTEQGHAIAVDVTGNAYVAGTTQATKFPTTPGAFDISYNGYYDTFVAKLSADGAKLVHGTYLGGSDEDHGRAIAVDAAGIAYVTGETSSTNFPTTSGALDTSYGGVRDVFVAKLSADGTNLDYATYLGGSSWEYNPGIAVDAAGNAFVSGATTSDNFPTTPGAFDIIYNGGGVNGGGDAFVAKLSADGSGLIYATYLGGSDSDTKFGMAVDAAGNCYVAGQTLSTDFPTTPGAFGTGHNGGVVDAFVAKLSANGASLVYATYLGGSSSDSAFGIAVDARGNAYLTGETMSSNFPTTPGAFDTHFNGADGFVAKLSPAGTRLWYGTYLGASALDVPRGIAVDAAGNAYVTGYTGSTNFPTTSGAFDTSFNGNYEAFVSKLSSDGRSLVYGTYLGGADTDAGYGIAVDAAGSAYVTGETDSSNFPTTPGALKRRNRAFYDGFVTKFTEA